VAVKETRVNIDREDPAGAAHLLGQPQRHASRPESHLQAAPAVAHAEVGQALRGVAVEQGLDPAQPIAFLLPTLVKYVRVHVSPPLSGACHGVPHVRFFCSHALRQGHPRGASEP